MSVLTDDRDPGWIGCIDFGTALSKAAIVRALPRNEVEPSDILPLAIGERDGVGVRNPLLLPSVVFIDEKTILFGQEAEDAAIRAEQRQRHAFRSLKQYLSTHDLEDLDGPLPSEIDPTGKYTPRAALELFLAHLLERAGESARKAGKPWPVRLDRQARLGSRARRPRRGGAQGDRPPCLRRRGRSREAAGEEGRARSCGGA